MKTYRFKADIKPGDRGGAYVEFPYDVQEEFGARGLIKIKATFDHADYRGSLAPMGGGKHLLGVTKAIRKAIGKDIGDTVDVTVERDTTPRTVSVPHDLKVALKKIPGAVEAFEKLSYTNRKEMVRSLETAKKPETRSRRLEKILEKFAIG